MSMDIQTQKALWEFENLGLLWSILDAGLELGVINEYGDGVVINVTAISKLGDTTKEDNWLDATGIPAVANKVNEYMDNPTCYQRGSVNSLVKLIGDKLLQTFEGKQVKIDF
jgi:hypothetical protein